MKRVAITNGSRLLIIMLLSSIIFTAKAQKLPKVQSISKRAPANIKIDGKTTEWNNVFQAYNPLNHIFYTISNDDDNLYFTARTSDELTIEKAMDGITFSIKLPKEKGNKKSKKNVAIVFPIPDDKQTTKALKTIIRTLKWRVNDKIAAGKKRIDSLSQVANKKINNLFKEIKVTGVDKIQEPSISIYNDKGIKAAAQFNSQMQYIYEIAVPLKYLNASVVNGREFSYDIKLNGTPDVSANGFQQPMVNGIGPFRNRTRNLGGPSRNPTRNYLNFPTDFSGKYILAKKNLLLLNSRTK